MDRNERMTEEFFSTPEMYKIGSTLYHMQMNSYPETKTTRLYALDFQVNEPFYYCQTGMPKMLYHDKLMFPGKAYQQLFETQLYPVLTSMLDTAGFRGNIYMITDDSKEIGVVFQPDVNCTTQPLNFAEQISQQVHRIYSEHFPHGTGRYCNTTALSGALTGVEGIRLGYLQTEALKAAAFFRMTSSVITNERLQSLRNGVTYRDVINLCRTLCHAIAQGEDARTLALCEQLFCDMLKHSFDLELVRDALSYIKQFLSVRLAILLPEMECDLGALCNVQTYSTIEECHEAILPLLIRLCHAVQQQGPWCDAVADAAYYLCSNIQKDITLSEIAAYADAAPAYLSNLFHQQTGLTIKQYQQKIRLEYACRLLRTTDAKVSDIAKQSGFGDRRYFTKVFKETYGAVPQKYRK